MERRIPAKLYNLIRDGFDGTSVSATHALQEIFANWFDWRYLFNCDTSFFLEAVWKSWLKLPVVLQKPRQYLARTFTIFLSQDFETYHGAYEAESEPILQEYLLNFWRRYVVCVSRNIPEFRSLASGLGDEILRDVFDEATLLIQAVYFYDTKLESVCHINGLQRRLNPAYPRLTQHLRALERGEVITDPIPNPCRLELELLRRSRQRPISLATQGAFIFSLENSYLRTTQRAT
jgi:hypothetical protein